MTKNTKIANDAAVIIVHSISSNKVVMVESTKKNSSAIGFPGGGVEEYDAIGDGSNKVFNANMAAIRELQEETGLKIQELKHVSSEEVSFEMYDSTLGENVTVTKTIHGFYASIRAPAAKLSYDIRENKAKWIELDRFRAMPSIYRDVNNLFLDKAIEKGIMTTEMIEYTPRSPYQNKSSNSDNRGRSKYQNKQFSRN